MARGGIQDVRCAGMAGGAAGGEGRQAWLLAKGRGRGLVAIGAVVWEPAGAGIGVGLPWLAGVWR
jgi:hypothetical protein